MSKNINVPLNSQICCLGRKNIVIIPALDPSEALLDLVTELHSAGFERLILVDDGSGAEYKSIFEKAKSFGCQVVRHAKNLGKGAAIKSGIGRAIEIYGRGIGIITADADGQHRVSDIVKVDEAMNSHPGKLILGTRDFSKNTVPFRSRYGNKITSLVFRLVNGKNCPDTQTGLRGIPWELLSIALSEEGSRYEYEMNFLSDAADQCEMAVVPIETIYEDKNKCSHFRPVRDSLLIYGRLLRFLISSLAGSVTDLAIFSLLLLLLPLAGIADSAAMIIKATVIARFCSGAVNFILNKKYAFRSKENTGIEGAKYFILFLCQMGASGALVSVLSNLLPTIASKVLIDSCLFFISYLIQKRWVFKKITLQNANMLRKESVTAYRL